LKPSRNAAYRRLTVSDQHHPLRRLVVPPKLAPAINPALVRDAHKRARRLPDDVDEAWCSAGGDGAARNPEPTPSGAA
jgi:hypothetical protein